MTDQEEFEEWFKSRLWLTDGSTKYWKGWMACAERKNAIIDQQAKELEALRGFANDMYECWSKESEYYMEQRGLIDENGNPTPILTGAT